MAGGGLVLLMLTSFACLIVLTVLIRRKRSKGILITSIIMYSILNYSNVEHIIVTSHFIHAVVIVMTPNAAYEEVNHRMRYKRYSRGQLVQSSNQNS